VIFIPKETILNSVQRTGRRYVIAILCLAALAVAGPAFLRVVQSDETTETKATAKPPAETAAQVEPVQKDAPAGRRVPPLVLDDPAGKPVSLADFREKNYLAVTFINCECPLSNQYLPVLNEIQAKYAERGLQVIAVNSHAGNSKERIAGHAKEYGITFPVLCDPRQVAADVFGAQRTCETFLLDPQRYIRYHGRIDDRYHYTAKRDKPTRDDLTAALDELLAGEPVSVAETTVEGCLMSRVRRVGKSGEITYARQVARIFREKCEVCHHPNTAAPFALQTHEDATNWSAMIKEVVQQRRMPPWHVDPRFGDFKEERRLTQEEIDTIVAWVNDGAPAGDLNEAPPAVEYADGWKIGNPDVVFELPVDVPIPAKGTIPYLYFKTKTNFTEDMWIEAAEARPGNRAAVHHILLFYEAPGIKPNIMQNWIDGKHPARTPSGHRPEDSSRGDADLADALHVNRQAGSRPFSIRVPVLQRKTAA
jgi:peroxiredoxin/mono/diheme cytochrome c family protein